MRNDALLLCTKSRHCNWNTSMYITTKAVSAARKYKIKLMKHIYHCMTIKVLTSEFSYSFVVKYQIRIMERNFS